MGNAAKNIDKKLARTVKYIFLCCQQIYQVSPDKVIFDLAAMLNTVVLHIILKRTLII